MKNVKMIVSDVRAGVDHDLRWDGGRQISWVAGDGKVRVPQEVIQQYDYPGTFPAAGNVYTDWHALCVKEDDTGHICQDVYGREVFCISEQFPCFDSYDYLYENRYYRWFFILDEGKLTRIYYSDGQKKIQVTEDVFVLENKCLETMEKMNWPR